MPRRSRAARRRPRRPPASRRAALLRRRLDAELVRRGLASSRSQAARLVETGQVVVAGAPAGKPSRLVAPHEALHLTGPAPRYVGRGGDKLEAALRGFEVRVEGRAAIDAGSSTGGFTDCLLQSGARLVVAVDVGRAQLHERLRNDARVHVRERTDIRDLDLSGLGIAPDGFDVVVADLSFISLRSVAASLLRLAADDADLVLLVKPQFEAGRAAVSRGRGVIREPEVWRTALAGAIAALEEAGASNMGVMASPLRGADGNVEFLAHFRRGPARPAAAGIRVDAAVRAAATAAAAGSAAGKD